MKIDRRRLIAAGAAGAAGAALGFGPAAQAQTQAGATGKVDQQLLRKAMVMGSVMASFTVEKFSLERLREVQRPEIHARFAEFKKLTLFDDLGPLGG